MKNKVLARAIASILSASAACATRAQDPHSAAADASEYQLQEVIVTATHREETLQNVPITMQALTAETLKQLNVQTFDDFVKYLPNVTYNGDTPGQQQVYMRGLATGAANSGGTVGTTGPFPNVAIYLDEQSGALPGRNLDVYAVDLQRIEVLEGPQGTLFGAGAEAGVIRYITNPPKLNVLEGNLNGGYGITAGGNPSTNVDATINIPLITDKLAFRGSLYSDKRGGYLSNPTKLYQWQPTDAGIVAYFGGVVPPNSGPVSNAGEPHHGINPVTYTGVRASILYQINDDWNARLTQSYQNMDAEGLFSEEVIDALGNPMPPRSAYEVGTDDTNDKFENTALVITGHLHDWELLYAGSYLDRTVTQQTHGIELARYSSYVAYYDCAFPGYPFIGGQPTLVNGQKTPGFCWTPLAWYNTTTRNTHQSHELRLTSPAENRIRGIAGLFWEKYEIFNVEDYGFGSAPIFQPIGPPTINPYTTPATTLPASCNDCSIRPYGDMWTNDVQRGYQQKALYASFDFDLIPKVLTITGGTRWYRTENFEKGFSVGSYGCEINGPYDSGTPAAPTSPPNPCVSTVQTGVLSSMYNLDAEHLGFTYHGFLNRGNLTWHVTPDIMVYYTYSQGYRPGGFNRSTSQISKTSPLYGVFTPPLSYTPDYLINNEVGWKTEWLNHRLVFNGSVYQERWKDVQINIFDPGVTGDLVFEANGPDYRVRGLETTVAARVVGGLTVDASASWNSSEVVKTLSLVNPTTHQPITSIANPFGALGAPLAQAPPFQASARARYEVNLGDYGAFAQFAASHRAHSYNSTDRIDPTNLPIDMPGFTTYDLTLGVGRQAWLAQFVINNLTNVDGVFDASRGGLAQYRSVIPPRTMSVRLNYKF